MPQIEHANPTDAQKVWSLAESVRLNYQKPQKEGFLVYVLNKDQYLQRIITSPFFYVAKTIDADIEGFLMCYDDKTLQQLITNSELSHEDGITKFLTQQPAPYIYGDQIGINNCHAQTGIGNAMMKNLFKEMQTKNIDTMYVAIMHHPIKNTASINFCSKLGFTQVAEITNIDSRVWGIYQKANI